MPVGQIENGFLRQLLGVISTRSTLKNDHIIGINDMEVTDPAVGDPIHVTLDEPGKFLVVFAESEATKI